MPIFDIFSKKLLKKASETGEKPQDYKPAQTDIAKMAQENANQKLAPSAGVPEKVPDQKKKKAQMQ